MRGCWWHYSQRDSHSTRCSHAARPRQSTWCGTKSAIIVSSSIAGQAAFGVLFECSMHDVNNIPVRYNYMYMYMLYMYMYMSDVTTTAVKLLISMTM